MIQIIQDNQNQDRPQRVVEKFHSIVCLGNKMADEIKEWKVIHGGKYDRLLSPLKELLWIFQ